MWFDSKSMNLTDLKSGENSDYAKTLGRNTTKFDACGAYIDGETIAYPSQYSEWYDCIAFLEWFGIPLMPGFIPILVDDKNPSTYEYLFQLMRWDYDPKELKSPNCFDRSNLLRMTAAILSIYSFYVI